MIKKTSQQLSDFLSFVREITAEYHSSFTEVGICDKETDDLLHQIELGSYKERGKFATKLALVRSRRRIHKNVVDVNKELVAYLEENEFKKVYRKLEQLLGNCRKQEQYVENERIYKPKVRSDLTIT